MNFIHSFNGLVTSAALLSLFSFALGYSVCWRRNQRFTADIARKLKNINGRLDSALSIQNNQR